MGIGTTRLIGDPIPVCLMYDLSGEQNVILVVAKLREILAVSKEAAHKIEVEIFHLRNWRLGKNFRLTLRLLMSYIYIWSS